MDLSKLYRKLLLEAGPFPPEEIPGQGPPPVDPANPQAPMPSMVPPPAPGTEPMPPPAPPPISDRSVVELPSVNMNVSVFLPEKKLIFSAQDHTSYTEKIKKYVNFFKRNFRIDSINSLKGGSFEIVFDPREKFMAAIDFLQKLAEHDAKTAI